MKQHRERRILILTLLLWTGIVGGLAWWNVSQIKQADRIMGIAAEIAGPDIVRYI